MIGPTNDLRVQAREAHTLRCVGVYSGQCCCQGRLVTLWERPLGFLVTFMLMLQQLFWLNTSERHFEAGEVSVSCLWMCLVSEPLHCWAKRFAQKSTRHLIHQEEKEGEEKHPSAR